MKINEYNQMMKYLTRPARSEPEYEQVAMAGPFKGGKKLIQKLFKKGDVKKGEAPKTDIDKVKSKVESDQKSIQELADNNQIPVKDQTVKSPYKFTGDETLDDLYKLEEEGILSRSDYNVYGERYLDYVDAQVAKRFGYTEQEVNKMPIARLNVLRAKANPNWAEANYGDDYMRILEKERAIEAESLAYDDPEMFDNMFNKMQEEMDDYIPGEKPLTKNKRTLNAEGGRIGFEGGGLAKDVQNFLINAFPNEDLNFKDYKYGVSSAQNRNLYKRIEYIADQRIKKGKNYKYVPSGTDFSELEYEKGYGNADQFVKKAKEKGITISKAKRFAKSFDIDTKKSPYQKSGSDKIYDMTVLDDPEFVEDVIKRQVKTGTSSNKEMIKKYGQEIKYKSEQEIRAGAKRRRQTEKRMGGDPKFKQVPKKSGAQKSHMGDIWSETIKPENIGVAPAEINKALADPDGIEDQIKKLTQKRKRLIKQNPADLKKQLTEINNQLYNLEEQAQGFKRVPFVDPVTKETIFYGGGRFPMDPTGQVEGMTEREAREFRNKYLTKKGEVKPKWLDKKGNFVGSLEDFNNLEKAIIFDQNYKDMIKTVSKQKKPLTKSFFNPPAEKILKDVVSGRQVSANPFMDMIRVAAPSLPAVLGPSGLAAMTYAFRPEGGYDLSKPEDRLTFELEAALAPTAVKGTSKAASYLAGGNQPLRRGLERVINLGMRAPTALKLARVASPIGLLSLAGEAGYYTYKKAQEQQAIINAMTPHQKELYESQMAGEALMGEAENFANGGRVGFEKGGSSSDKKKTTPALDKPKFEIDPNAPVDPGRRDFMEKGAGVGALGAAIATGLVKFGPEISKLKKIVGSLDVLPKNAPEWLLPLYKKIKSLGKESKVEPTKEGGTGYKVTDLKTEDGSYKIVENEKTGEVVISADTSAGVNEGPLDFIVRPKKITGVNSDGTPIVDPGEFKMVENKAVGRIISPEDYEIDIEEYVTDNLDDLGSDWHAVEEFAIGKTDKTLQAKKLEGKKFIEENPGEDVVNRQGEYDYMGDDSMMEDY